MQTPPTGTSYAFVAASYAALLSTLFAPNPKARKLAMRKAAGYFANATGWQ